MTQLTCDVAIIGAGTAGLAAERSARAAGVSTLLIDDAFAGTTCASVGCMPSKLLIAAADAAHAVRTADLFGVGAPPPVIDGLAVMARVRRERDRFVAGVKHSFTDIPDGIMVHGRARFLAERTLELEDGRRIEARAVVIATGSAPSIPQTMRAVADRLLTNETIFELPDLPASVGVVGAGPIGLELAQALCRLGVDVMLFDQGTTLAGLKDEVVARELATILGREFPLRLGVTLAPEPCGDGVMLSWSGEEPGRRRFDRLLVAAGRPPNLAKLGLDATGLALDEHGTPVFDRHTLQCGDAPIFIAGDADHDRPVLHEASDEGTIAGHNAASFPNIHPGRRRVPLSIMFTDPPLTVLGSPSPSTDDPTCVVGVASYADQGRARVMARNAGIVRLYADASDGRLTGASMLGPGVDHTGHLIAWAVQQSLTATQVLDLPFYHPTYEEGLKPALRSICHDVHAPAQSDRDQGISPGA